MKIFFTLIKSILLKVFIAVVIGLGISWFLGWREITQYVNVITAIGGIIIIFGILSVLGDWKGRANFGYLYGRSSGKEDTIKYAKNEINDTVNKYIFNLYYIIVGLLTIATAIIIDKIIG